MKKAVLLVAFCTLAGAEFFASVIAALSAGGWSVPGGPISLSRLLINDATAGAALLGALVGLAVGLLIVIVRNSGRQGLG